MKRYRLTTIDNKFNPITEFDDWFHFDSVEHDYGTCDLIARIANTSDALSDEENEEEMKRACLEVISNDYEGIYVMVTADTP